MVIVLSTLDAYYTYALHFEHTFDPPPLNVSVIPYTGASFYPTASYIDESPPVREVCQVSSCVITAFQNSSENFATFNRSM